MNKYSEELQNYKDNVNFNQKNILDIGANEGIMIDFFLANSVNSKIIGIEPHPYNILILNNKFSKISNVKLIQGAVNNNNGKCFIGFENQQRKNGLKQGHVYTENKNYDMQGRIWNQGMNVKSLKLDELCLSENIQIIKMDIEGFEHKILYDMLPLINNIDVWMIEIHSWEDLNLHGWNIDKFIEKNDSLHKLINLFYDNGYNDFILAKNRNFNNYKVTNGRIDKNIYWKHIPVNSYYQNGTKKLYKVINLIIKK